MPSKKSHGIPKSSLLKLLANVMQSLQRHEFEHTHSEWVNIVKPDLHPAVSAQLREEFEVSELEIGNSKSVRSELRVVVSSFLKDHCLLKLCMFT